ncbi:MAG: helix-turn-helix transcriptional regulator [Gordonia polyisoprenivorans]|nr:helix-turn-helix transcriptional regulator [Gordonia polyisoprenivorans]
MNETDTLRGLIGKARREREKSIRQLALEAKAAGYKIVGTTLSAIESGTYKSTPTIETIRAIGWLANVDDTVSFAAAGKRLPGPPFAAELPPGVDELEDDERKAAISVLRALVALRREINGSGNSDGVATQAPGTPSSAGEGEKTPDNVRSLKPRDPAPPLDSDTLAANRGPKGPDGDQDE